MFLAALFPVLTSSGSPWSPESSASASKAVSLMALSQKISLVHGHSIFDIPYVGNVPETQLSDGRSLPPLHLEDGPSGAADALSYVTAFPNAGTVLQSWSADLMYAFGEAMSLEQYGKGTNVALAPAVNLCRVPWGGRCFEYLGEDPKLAATLVAHLVRGLQSHNISACVKHAFLNAQETNRNSVSENAPNWLLQELYYPPFRAAVDAGVGSAMCSYNRVNNVYACENNETLWDLKEGMGFRGWVMSDWYATHSTVDSALAGLDQEMPGGFYFSGGLQQAVLSGEVSSARLDDMVSRILTPMYALGLVNDPPTPQRNVFVNVTSPAHNALARQLAERSIVLMKNDAALLPLDPHVHLKWVVFGDESTVLGEGSGGVTLPYLITPAQGIQAALRAAGSNATVTFYPPSTVNASTAASLAAAADVACVVVATTSSEGSDRGLYLDLPPLHNELVEAVAVAQKNTVVIARCPGACTMPWLPLVHSLLFEGMPGQESGNSIGATLIGANNPSGKLALSFPNSEKDTWLSTVPGGAVDPARWPGVDLGKGYPESNYSEGLLMGWPWYEANNRTPLFAFGHGLSYSTFLWGEAISVAGFFGEEGRKNVLGDTPPPPPPPPTLSSSDPLSSLTLHFSLRLAPGSPLGTETVQMYIGRVRGGGEEGRPIVDPKEPPRRLLSFQNVSPGYSSTNISFTVRVGDLARFVEEEEDGGGVSGAWRVTPGAYRIDVGSSSRDTKLSTLIWCT